MVRRAEAGIGTGYTARPAAPAGAIARRKDAELTIPTITEIVVPAPGNPPSLQRLLVLAPHPDDESLATGTLLQRAQAMDGMVTVAWITSGENNPWAQRVVERRLFIGPQDRARFGALREQEALAALVCLQLPRTCGRFLRFPDQGLTRGLLHEPAPILAALARLFDETRPTLVAYPSLADLHPDHSALGVLTRLALQQARILPPPQELTFLVHHPTLRPSLPEAFAFQRTPTEASRQRAAVAAHRSQMVWRRRWMFEFLATPERFFAGGTAIPHLPLAARRTPEGDLELTLASRPRWRAWGPPTVVGVVEGPHGVPRAFSLPVRRAHGRRTLVSLANGTRDDLLVTGARGTIPSSLAPPECRCFLKLERRYGFFDEGGWLEVPPSPPRFR